MDILASKSLLLEDNIFARFYYELLHCLRLVLTRPRGYPADHVAGFVETLRFFFRYGLVNKAHVMNQATNHKTEVVSTSQNLPFDVSNRSRSGAYRPPHLRRKVVGNQQHKDEERLVSSRHGIVSSDSDCNENDGPMMDSSSVHFAKVRTAAASTVMTMLDGPASMSLQVAEYREHSKCGSFTTLSSSLGHILMQLHLGTLYLIKHETNTRLLALTFKILVLLVSSTPYSRMSPELLLKVISSVQSKIDDGFLFHNDRNNLQATAINCLSIALSVSASTHVNNMLLGEISTGSLEGQRSGVLCSLFQLSEQLSSPSISLEAFQALKAVAHNYPNVMALYWEQVSSVIYGVLSSSSHVSARLWRGSIEHSVASIKERVMTAAVTFISTYDKTDVLDECLRAISGFRGTEDLSNDKSLRQSIYIRL